MYLNTQKCNLNRSYVNYRELYCDSVKSSLVILLPQGNG